MSSPIEKLLRRIKTELSPTSLQLRSDTREKGLLFTVKVRWDVPNLEVEESFFITWEVLVRDIDNFVLSCFCEEVYGKIRKKMTEIKKVDESDC